ncbi:PAS domain S-box-containing protein [Anaerospora hongkongensis]|uniref:PAS domain S-box-containing protein n=1 Tax=Anaerospora hongkongensis TaxID=244830 RepID=A0A4R1PZ19_9FIRM|nr:sigma 54-interacting transcriptional regulator [Anaerospora hongkongensis]TCL36779.1 PAS domain S-box-containing protein [Anaerospora hongkongensis]
MINRTDNLCHNINATLQEIVLLLLQSGRDKFYFDYPGSEDKQGILDEKEVLAAFAGGVPGTATLKELEASYRREIKGKNETLSAGQLVECYFKEFLLSERFIDILNAIHNGIMVVDKENTVTFINSAYTRLTGVTPEDMIGRNLCEARPSAKLPQAVFSGKTMYGIHRKVGKVEYIVDCHPIIVRGVISGGVSILRDITELQNLVERLRKYRTTVNTLTGRVKEGHKAKYTFADIIGESPLLLNAKKLAGKVAGSDINVLIIGESGTGKELFAHAIHNESQRRQDAFVVVNCASIPKNLLESELFGYEAGAFTGASKSGKAGLLEIADSGTLFLDEIGDMDLELQAKLLRVLQLGQYQRVGSTETCTVDVRIIAATNRDLEKMVELGNFRGDFYYRLNVAQIKVPPLKDRSSDLDILARHFLENADKYGMESISLADETMDILRGYSWPGNVREFENTLKFLASITDSPVIAANSLPDSFLQRIVRYKDNPTSQAGLLSEVVASSEEQLLIRALNCFGRTVAGKRAAAKSLGISLATLYNKISHYNI